MCGNLPTPHAPRRRAQLYAPLNYFGTYYRWVLWRGCRAPAPPARSKACRGRRLARHLLPSTRLSFSLLAHCPAPGTSTCGPPAPPCPNILPPHPHPHPHARRRIIQQYMIDMENLFDLLDKKPHVSASRPSG
jgi:hypothetical protein